jgi:hypothetical protein
LNPLTIVTLSGPILGVSGWLLEWPWLFWLGAALSVLNLLLNLASGAMRLPLLPSVAALIGALLAHSWFVGAAAGLLLYTAIEGISELFAKRARV